MKITEILTESYISPQIPKMMRKKGYKFLGKGVDQMAFLAPDGWILKIFGTSTGRLRDGLTRSQRTFKAFADYCQANPNNPFLPNFSGWKTFQYAGKTYLEIRVERMFPFKKGSGQGWDGMLERVADEAEHAKSNRDKQEFIDYAMETKYGPEFLSYLGKDGFDTLWNTIYDLGRIARKLGIGGLDLHSGNFMLGSDGHMVITDPFYAGEW